MINELIQKTIIALKQGNFLEKLLRVLNGKLRKIKIKYFKFNLGNLYHGKTANNYELKRIKQDWWHDEIRVLSEFLKLLPKGISVLDVPIGTARFLPLYHENQMTVSGLDISRDMLSEAKRLRWDFVENCKIDIGDARNLPYGNNSFDVIVCFRFLDGHVTFKDAKKVISEFCRVSSKYLILELGAVSEGGGSEVVLQNLPEDQPINARLSERERINLFKTFGLRVIAREAAYSHEKPFMTVYLCEQKLASLRGK